MRMQGYSPEEFADLLIGNGWRLAHRKSNHASYTKTGRSNLITISFHGKELSRPLAKRLLKEAGIC